MEVTYNKDNVSITSDFNDTQNKNINVSNPIMNIEAEKKKLDTYNFVNNPDHYMHYDMSTYEMMLKIWGKKETMIWCKLTAWKYRQRMGTKPGESVQRDLDKEKWYLDKYHELKNQLKNE